MIIRSISLLSILFTFNRIDTSFGYKVIYAVNCGGDEHIDSNGIKYEKDTLKIGTASDYGRNLGSIGRVEKADELIYQTERYHTATFGYEIPISGDGDYLLVLKFCEVYFNSANAKVFDVVLNADHQILSDLDIYGTVGKGIALDEYIYFSISRNRLYYKEEESEIRGGKIRVEFIKGYRDNPKINGIVLMKGSDVNNIPKLPPLSETPEPQVEENTVPPVEEEKPIVSKPRKTSGPKTESPYDESQNQLAMSIFVGIVLFIPLLFCLCRL
ncbi:hypothetical protein PVAND_005713 [Polypedilum vanderplanki]|uniref:Malectin domain-containing protein n=1 Tax=Polypedilum vanderplanki TaxID=319348 RepID=A0A9J6C209_POLVA|nr:hypothetical protein PVAND_005713 [Polypedilum vanderplanki]